MLPQPAGSVDLPTRPAPPHRATLATPLVRPNPRRSHTPKPQSHRSRTPARAAAAEVQVGFFPKASSQDADVATGGVPDDQSGVFKLGPHSNVGLPRPQRSPRVRPCDIVQQALERGILVGNNRRSHERSSVHAAFFDDDLIWETSPGLADQPEELLKPKDSLSKSFKPHSPGRRNRDKQSPSQPPPKDNANLTEVISNKILLKYFSTTLDKVDSPLEIWNVVKKCTDEIAALTGTAPSLRPKMSRNSASKPSDIPYPLAEQRDSGVELTPKDHQSQSPVKGWPEARPRSNSSSYDSGFHSDRKSVSPERQYTATTEAQDASGVTSRGPGTGGFTSHAGQAGSSNPISFSRPRRKRNARETGGDDSSQDEGDSDAGDDRGKPPFDHDRAKHKKTRLTDPESNLSCPFRKRNPLRFNIRDHHPCAGQGFPNMAVLKRHIRTFHKREQALHICVRCQQGFSTPDALTNHLNVPIDEMCASRPVQPGGDPEDGITHKVENSLIERKASSKVDNWEGLWKKLFPFDQDVPEPDFEPPIELDEVYVEFRTVLPRLIYTLQEQTSTALQRHGPHHSLQHVLEPICDNFVEHTFSHCRRSLAKNPRRYMRPKKEQPQQQGEQTANPSHTLAMQQQYAQIAPCPSSSSQSVSPFPPRASRGDHIPTPTSLTQDHYPAVEPISRPKTAFREIPEPIPSSSSLDILGNTVPLSRPDTLQHSIPDDPNLIQTDSAIDLSTIDSRDSQFDDKCGLWSDSNSMFTCSSNSGDHIDLAHMNDAFIWDMNTLMR